MKNALYASVAIACLAFAVPAGAQQPAREPAGRAAPSETRNPDAMKPDAAPARGGAAQRPARPEEGNAAQMRGEKAGEARDAEPGKAEQRPDRAGAEAPKAAQKPGPRDDAKSDHGRDAGESAPQGRADRAKGGRGDDGAQPDKAVREDRGKPGQERENPRAGRDDKTRTGERAAGERRDLDDGQRSRLSAYFERHKGPRVNRVDFSVQVGVRIPARVRVAPLPREIVAIVPEYRGYDYVIIEDEIVILRPRTREIVTIIPASATSSARGAKLDPCGDRS